MKILHTSDWHLGKLFYEKSLIEDQEYVLNQIIDIAKKAEEEGSPYGALVVSGDIYDRGENIAVQLGKSMYLCDMQERCDELCGEPAI